MSEEYIGSLEARTERDRLRIVELEAELERVKAERDTFKSAAEGCFGDYKAERDAHAKTKADFQRQHAILRVEYADHDKTKAEHHAKTRALMERDEMLQAERARSAKLREALLEIRHAHQFGHAEPWSAAWKRMVDTLAATEVTPEVKP